MAIRGKKVTNIIGGKERNREKFYDIPCRVQCFFCHY